MNQIEGLLPVVSNLVGFATAIKWYGAGHGIVPLVFIGSAFFSIWYHACDWYSGLCILRYQLLHDLDFTFAQSIITTIAMSLIHWVSPDHSIAYPVGVPFLQTAFLLFFILVNAILVAVTDDGLVVQAIIFGSSFGVVVAYNLVYRCRFGRFPKYNLTAALPAVALTSVSVMLFSYQNQHPRYYWLIHSAWHVLAYAGGWYWASVMPSYDPKLNVGSRMMPQPASSGQNPYAVRKVVKIV